MNALPPTQKLYEEKLKALDLIELVKGSGDVDTSSFLPHKVLFSCGLTWEVVGYF